MKTSLSLVMHLSLGIFSVLLFIAFCSILYSYGPALGKLLNRKNATQNKYSEKGYRDVNFNISRLDGANISTSKTIRSVHSQKLSNRPRSIYFAVQGGNYTKSRPGGHWVELWRQPRVSLILFFLVTFRYFVSEMVLTCAVSIYIICKYGNGEIFTQSEERNGSRHL